MEITSYKRRDRQYEILVNFIMWWWIRTSFFRSSGQIEKFIMLWSFMSVLCWLKGTVMKIKKLPEDSRSSKKIKSWNFCIPVIYNSEVILFRRLVFRYKSKHTKRCSFSFFSVSRTTCFKIDRILKFLSKSCQNFISLLLSHLLDIVVRRSDLFYKQK